MASSLYSDWSKAYGPGASGYSEPRLAYPEQLRGLRIVNVRDHGTCVIVTIASGEEYRVPAGDFHHAVRCGLMNPSPDVNEWKVRYMGDWREGAFDHAQQPQQTTSPVKVTTQASTGTTKVEEKKNPVKRLYFARLHKK